MSHERMRKEMELPFSMDAYVYEQVLLIYTTYKRAASRT